MNTRKQIIRTDILNTLIHANRYKSYLEIGVRDAKNFKRVVALEKDGVDPAGNCNYPVTSDDFFKQLSQSKLYDLIFIDGLHLKEQVLRDVYNSLQHLSVGGTIVMHDCNPVSQKYATAERKPGAWNGTVWEAWAELRMSRIDLEMCVVDTDHGCGIIRRGSQTTFPREHIEYRLLADKRRTLLNLISVDEFKRKYGSQNLKA